MNYRVGETVQQCRFCKHTLTHSMVDLGSSPLCEDFLVEARLHAPEVHYPLEALVCEQCWLVQAVEYTSNSDIFNHDYGYYSSFSTSWLAHAKRYVDTIVERRSLDDNCFVVEIASNDGYLLRNFVERGIPCLGIDPASNVAEAAREVGVDTEVSFFDTALAQRLATERSKADLIIGNNVLAHTPYINDFVAAVKVLLKPEGMATFEFPHLLELIQNNQFDTIYHEHFSYYSLRTVQAMFVHAGLKIVDVELLKSAGGSLRIYIEHDDTTTAVSGSVQTVLDAEHAGGLFSLPTYTAFADRVVGVKHQLLEMLLNIRKEGKTVAGYGAPGKGNTLLNYCGIKPDLLPYTVDLNHHKHGRYLPGSHIPVYPTERLQETRPDYILILPWNLTREIVEQLAYTREWGARFIAPIPTPVILDQA